MKAAGWGRFKINYLSESCSMSLVETHRDTLRSIIEAADDYNDLRELLNDSNMSIQFKSGTPHIWIVFSPGCYKARFTVSGSNVIFKEGRPI